ncbi:MAG TPA: hypothetical protein VM432_07645 [Bdellovibrionales bacterium]|nr:hypothetical protein [Bdellovibrionales bacterium]
MVTVHQRRKRENYSSLAEQGNETSCQCNRTGEATHDLAPVVSQGQNEVPSLARGWLWNVLVIFGTLLFVEPKLVRQVCPNSRPQERHEFEKRYY